VINGQHLIGDAWVRGEGPAFRSSDPATGEPVCEGREAIAPEVDQVVAAARSAFEGWAELAPARRQTYLERFAERLGAHREELAELISTETGKQLWESIEEVGAMAGKVPLSVQAIQERRLPSSFPLGGATAAVRFKPHGVVAVFGPFNIPGHLPNGHIVPALLAGNTVIFKPSELAPAVAQRTVELWLEAGLPTGVLNLLHGARQTGVALARHRGLDGLFFTGSAAAGVALSAIYADQPQKILALEMGGNNPLVVWDVHDAAAAAFAIVQSAYVTAGQRCSCARHLILPEGVAGDAVIEHLAAMTRLIRVGHHRDRPEPYLGPVISDAAAERLLSAKSEIIARGGIEICEMRSVEGARRAMLRPGLIDVTNVPERPDVELFGPLLQIIRVPSFDAALREANNTAYGLVAGLLSDDRQLYEQFYRRVRAGVINWNRPTTGASSRLPFGGVGLSGNHRPSAYYAVDYCTYPVASLEIQNLSLPKEPIAGLPLPEIVLPAQPRAGG